MTDGTYQQGNEQLVHFGLNLRFSLAINRNKYAFPMIRNGNPLALKVILDSNFLFVPSQFQIDIFEELLTLLNQRYEPILLSTTYKELQRMAEKGSPKLRKQAAMALKLAEKCRVVDDEKSRGETNDDVILRVAAQLKCPVATNDRRLKQRLRNISIPVIYLRQKSRLALEGSI